MSTKKSSATKHAFRATVRGMIKEELGSIMTEAVNRAFMKVGNKPAFKAWIMRQWFDPAKHKDRPWFKPQITADNVLEYISTAKSFPYSALQMVDMWGTSQHLKKYSSILPSDKEEVDAPSDSSDSEDSGPERFTGGAASLKQVADVFNQTPPAIKKAQDVALARLRSDGESFEDILARLDSVLPSVAKFYAGALAGETSTDDFLATLAAKGVLPAKDMGEILAPQELKILDGMVGKSAEAVAEDLMSGTWEKLGSFQMLLSKVMHPQKKRGRKPKVRPA
jgi:hypothetical protein